MANVHSEGLLWSLPRPARRDRARAASRPTLEVTVFWGTAVLAVRHLSPPRTFSVGEAVSADFVLERQSDGPASETLVEVESDEVWALLAHGARERLELGRKVSVARGGLTFGIELVPSETTRFPGAAPDFGWFGYLGAAALSAFGFVLALAAFVPPLGLVDDEELDRERLAVLLQYLDAEAERERLDAPDADRGGGAESTPREGSKGESGTAGKLDAPRRNTRLASNAPQDERDVTRAEALRDAATFGLIGILGSASPLHPGAIWDRDGALEHLDQVAFGNIFGRDIGDAAGSGGLGVSGTGEGSGSSGLGIGMGDGGICGSLGGCSGTNGGGGFGRSSHLGMRAHATTAPRVRTSVSTVTGRLPPEVVQRVVRQNHGRFRSCYEDGLRKNPTLNGRVTARFVIDRSGAVSLASNGGSDLPDSAVVACVVQTFYGLSFPAPDGGIVQVSYPIVFDVG